jgi:hypothetical protein
MSNCHDGTSECWMASLIDGKDDQISKLERALKKVSDYNERLENLLASQPAVPEVVERVAQYVESQQGGPYSPEIMAATIRAALTHRPQVFAADEKLTQNLGGKHD